MSQCRTEPETDDHSGDEDAKKSKKDSKKVTLRDYERRELLEKGAEKAFGGDSDTDDDGADHGKSYVEEQADIKSAFKNFDVVCMPLWLLSTKSVLRERNHSFFESGVCGEQGKHLSYLVT